MAEGPEDASEKSRRGRAVGMALRSRALGEALAAEGVRFADRTLRGFLKRHRMERRRRLAVRRQRKRWKASGG